MAENYTTVSETKKGLTQLKTYTDTELAKKQDKLTAGTGISIVNNVISATGSVAVDSALSSTSENPVQNKVIDAALQGKADVTALDDYVQKETGKGLSTNDFTDDDKTKLNDLAEIKSIGDRLTLSTAGELSADGQTFVAEYQVTTAQQIIAYLDAAGSAQAPLLVKRGNDYYTSIFTQKVNDTRVSIRALGTLSGSYYVFTYTVTNGTWASSSHGLQNLLVSGTNIKTVNGETLLGGGDIDVATADDLDAKQDALTAGDGITITKDAQTGETVIASTGSVTVDDALDAASTNPVQNKVIDAALQDKADASDLDDYVQKETGKGLSTNDFTNADKAALDGIGDLSDLQTTTKSSIVAAINELVNEGSCDDYTLSIEKRPISGVDKWCFVLTDGAGNEQVQAAPDEWSEGGGASGNEYTYELIGDSGVMTSATDANIAFTKSLNDYDAIQFVFVTNGTANPLAVTDKSVYLTSSVSSVRYHAEVNDVLWAAFMLTNRTANGCTVSPVLTTQTSSTFSNPILRAYGIKYGGSGTVDQTYDATSTNAQSGTAVAEALATVDGSTNFDVTPIPQGPTGANEINAIISNKDNENARLSYVRQSDGTLPNTVNLGVQSGIGEDSFQLPTKALVDGKQDAITGGTTGQALVKASDADGDFAWMTGAAGTQVQMSYDKVNDRLVIGNQELPITPNMLALLSSGAFSFNEITLETTALDLSNIASELNAKIGKPKGGTHFYAVHGRYRNMGLLIVNGIDSAGVSTEYGIAVFMSYYAATTSTDSIISTYRCENINWVKRS